MYFQIFRCIRTFFHSYFIHTSPYLPVPLRSVPALSTLKNLPIADLLRKVDLSGLGENVVMELTHVIRDALQALREFMIYCMLAVQYVSFVYNLTTTS